MRAAIGTCVVWSMLAVSAGAQAPRVVVVTSDAHLPAARRLRAELRALGFEPSAVVSDPRRLTLTGLEDIATDANAIAAISIAPSQRGATVWIIDRVTGKAVLRDVVLGEERDEDGAVLALRAVELLRASLMEVQAPHPPRGDVEASDAVRRVSVASTNALHLELLVATAVEWSPGGISPGWIAAVGAGWVPLGWLGLHLVAFLPIAPGSIEAAEGAADIWPVMIGGGVRLKHALDAFQARLDPGLGVLVQEMRGTANAPFASRADRVVVGVSYIRAGLGWALSGRLTLRADLTVGLTMTRTTVVFAGREVGSWGLPFLAAGLGLDVAL